jgi:hypothetical protein
MSQSSTEVVHVGLELSTDASLKKLHHAWQTNKCESMNQFVIKEFIQKSYHLCRTIIGRAPTYPAISIDSIGYDEYYQTLFPLLNIKYYDIIMQTHNERLDKNKIQKQAYTRLPAAVHI